MPRVLAAMFTGLMFWSAAAAGQAGLKVEVLAEPAPEDLAAPIREALRAEGLRVFDAEGKPWIDLWLRDAVPASEPPGGSKGTILFPFLAAGELVGAARFAASGHDYRDQEILEGSYTLRYGLQPVNGDHLGVSAFRDYLLVTPAADDDALAAPPLEELDVLSSNAAGTNHPAVYLLEAPPSPSPAAPAMVEDQANQRTSLLFELPARPEGSAAAQAVPMRLVLIGVGPH